MIPIKDNIPTNKPPVLTVSFILINVLIFFYEVSLPELELIRFIHQFGLLPVDIIYLNWEKILTSMFLHGSFAHLFGNMLFLWIFGNNVEDALGRFKFVIFYILSGVGAAVTQSFISLAFGNISTPMIGASGAISGIMAAYVKLYPEARILTIIPPFFFFGFILPAWFFVGYWFLIQVLFAVATPPTVGGVAWYAHIGGFITGWILINIMYTPKKAKIVHYSVIR
ncbi:MAG TPA: rhomboid family intramembrane serine protease [Persephonella sp.]|uniref:Rhomboid family protein n=1 Tax=Persephonella marina (strain DSM 14350 / EX-H1) TaxID=123214 RepID=C0QU40_PERMH|nr:MULTISPECIES: rhomboid family intramembrane serine protease [Persephonella]ACO04764.1 rhomboid family protein [Persephonella marina EX-H1]HCB70178.1 rhomboid family intramembrane serine protease [Persephonella sp.]